MFKARALGIDIGARAGFGLLAPDGVRSGSFGFLENWYPFGKAARIWEDKMAAQIEEYRPQHIGIAKQFFRRDQASPKNLIPMYWSFGTVLKLAADRGIAVHWIQESDARLAMLGAGNMPQKSEPLKAAIRQACKDRGWPACDTDASDALCIAAAVQAKLQPELAHQTTPLFFHAAPPPRRRKRKSA